MSWVLTITGSLLAAAALRDIFHTLWHPGGFGTLARMVFGVVWRATKPLNRGSRSTELAGPVGLLLTLALWTLLLVVGFALVYLPHMPDGFFFGTSLRPAESSDAIASLYLSMVSLTTLGLGDIQPAAPALRLVVPTQALLGFLLLTAGISWILQLYPALIRRRALARRLTTMARHGTVSVVERGEASIAVQHLEAVRAELATVELDLHQYAEAYYFREASPDLSLAAALPNVADLVDAGRRSRSAEVRMSAAMLSDSLEELLALLRREFLGEVGDVHATLAAYAADHQHRLGG